MMDRFRRFHEELKEAWPLTAYKSEATHLNEKLRKSGDEAFDDALPPVWFVGDMRNLKYVLIGVNPGRGSDGNPSWDAERKMLTADFETYWRSRPGYFCGPSYNRNHYDPTGTLIAALSESHLSPRDQLASSCVQLEMVPFFSKHQNLSVREIDLIRKTTRTGELAQQILRSCLDTAPDAVVFRGSGAALDCLLDEQDGMIDQKIPNLGSIGRLRSSSGRAIPLLTLSGNYAIAREKIRDLARLSRGEVIELSRHAARTGRRNSSHTSGLYDEARKRVLGLDSNITIRPRSGGIRSEAFRLHRNFVRLIEKSGSVELHVLDAPGNFRTDLRITNLADIDRVGPQLERAWEFGR